MSLLPMDNGFELPEESNRRTSLKQFDSKESKNECNEHSSTSEGPRL